MRFKRRKLEITPPYVAMADIAFNLVLFFVILAKTQDDSHIKWNPVKTKDVENEAKTSRMTVTVDKEGSAYFNGQPVSVLSLASAVTQHLQDNPGDPRVVLLKIHDETLASTFEAIIAAVSEAGCELFHVLDDKVID